MCGCLSPTPYWGPGLKARHVPWLGIEPATLWFADWHSIHWATPARAQKIILKSNFIYNVFEFRCHCTRQGLVYKVMQDILSRARIQYTFTPLAQVWFLFVTLSPHPDLLKPEDLSGPGKYLVGFLITSTQLIHICRLVYGKNTFKIWNIYFPDIQDCCKKIKQHISDNSFMFCRDNPFDNLVYIVLYYSPYLYSYLCNFKNTLVIM